MAGSSKSPSQTALLRLSTDLKEMQQSSACEGISASPASDNMFLWNATIFGPMGTPWEGGVFSLRMSFSDDYPNKPPRVRFLSEIFHPNVYSDGAVCLDIVQDAWSPVQSVVSVLVSLRSLLEDPNTKSPANPEASKLYSEDRPAYNKRVRRLAAKTVEG